MELDRRHALALMGATTLSPLLPRPAFAAAGGRRHATSLVGSVKYPGGFERFGYVNPSAPTGGEVRLGANGSFDSFNPFIVKGDAATGSGLVFESLMTSSLDESSTEYGLIAEWVEYPADYSSVTFGIREQARWHDGEPITPEDAIFSHRVLVEKGHPFFRAYYANVEKAEKVGDGVVRFAFSETGNRELPHIMGQLSILPAHWWESRDFARSGVDERLLGSGPYRVGEFTTGRSIAYERVGDYWGADLPVNVGQNNFGTIRYEYFKDEEAAFDAFKSGAIHYREENSSKRWATQYDFPALKRGEVVKREIVQGGPKATQVFAFNLRRDKFKDVRTREALALMFDFEWSNDALFYGQYARPASYFQGTEGLMATGVPEGAELALLEAHRDALDPRVFDQPYEMPQTDGSGRADRRQIRRAKKLLTEAGWVLDGGKLKDASGQPFEIEFLIVSKAQERVIAPMLRNFERLGIETDIRQVDAAQYQRRVEGFDYDMIVNGVANSESPGNEQREMWGSDAAERQGSRNRTGLADGVVDALIEKVIFAPDREALEAATRALDRVLLHGHYGILELYTPFERVAWWPAKAAKPDDLPDYSLGFPSIWWSPEADG